MTTRISREARVDMTGIWLHIAEDKNADVADKVHAEIMADVRRLARSPGIGHRRKDLTDENVLFWRVFSYLIVYRANDELLEIVRILHGARDIERLLNGD